MDSPQSKTDPGIYQHEGKDYTVKVLTVRRFQRLLTALAAVPLDKLVAALMPDEGEAEIGLAEVGDAIFKILPQVEDTNFIVELVSIALDIEQSEAENLPMDIGGRAIAHLFTSNLESLRSSPSFSTIEKNLKRGNGQPTNTPATERSLPESEKSLSDTAKATSDPSILSSAGSPE